MSVVIGFRRDNKIWMAADTRVSVDYTQYRHLTDSCAKIWSENNIIYGGVGILSQLQSFRFNHIIPVSDVLLSNIDEEYIFNLFPI